MDPESAHPTVIAAVGIGSNLGDRDAHIAAAVAGLRGLAMTQVLAVGPLVETAPVLPAQAGPDAHRAAGGAYLNTAALLRTGLEPRALLAALHAIERTRGRQRSADPRRRFEARTLDLDLLVYGELVIDEPGDGVSGTGLKVPHPRMRQRRFVLEPLAAIAPDLVVPGSAAETGDGGGEGVSVARLLAALADATGRELPPG